MKTQAKRCRLDIGELFSDPSVMSCVKGIVITEQHNEKQGVAEWGISMQVFMHHAVGLACASMGGYIVVEYGGHVCACI